MKTTGYFAFLLLLSCLLSAGCGNSQRAKLVGTWEIEQPESLMQRLDEPTAEDSADVDAEMSRDPKMLLEFFRNGRLATTTAMGSVKPTPKQGRWEMVSFDEPSQTMIIKCQIGLQESEHEVEFIDADTIKLVPPNMAGLRLKLRFQRKK